MEKLLCWYCGEPINTTEFKRYIDSEHTKLECFCANCFLKDSIE